MNIDHQTKQTNLMHSLEETTSDTSRILHDLNAPLINIRGFSSEIQESLTSMQELLDNTREPIDTNLQIILQDMISNDLIACLKMLNCAVSTLSERIDQLEYQLD